MLVEKNNVLKSFAEYDESTKFYIDNSKYTYKRFVNIFIHHDEHHKQQMEAFLRQERIA
ncbi:hypothetical protein [Paenibacillus senegalensis]|uniref:hypothetical protein n=1 Tax=Paenibacillus senegalensis TaxID=1465766 RepID=UPI0003001885|nr:hypothetical protein [Paenibacillus senegalensis]